MSRKLSLKALWIDTDGFLLPYVTMLLVVIIGLSLLAVDGARYFSLQTQLQHGADQLALSAATELDGAPDAISRAECALRTTLDAFPQSTLFGTGANQNVSLQPVPSCTNIQASSQICYLKDLPKTDNLEIQNCLDPKEPTSAPIAKYIGVTVSPVTIATILPASLFGGANVLTAPATSVAGFAQNVCKFTPMYVCNPYEPVRNTDYTLATQLLYANDPKDPDAPEHRTMLPLSMDPGHSLNPGNYGFLVSPLANGLDGLIDAVASISPKACFSRSGVTIQTGFGAQAIANAFNVRFDLYKGSQNGNRNDATYAPALNVRKGYIGPPCNSTQSNPPAAMALPPDNPPDSGTWDFDTYWLTEHPGVERRHDGRIAVDERNRRWCSDGFEIGCDNGERVWVAFALDCCDREAMSFLATTAGITDEDVRDLMVAAVEHRFGRKARDHVWSFGGDNIPNPRIWDFRQRPCIPCGVPRRSTIC